MTSIDEVIARSRQAGGFSEHRTFTLAKDRAIEKMRQFALADPHYYILELIQSAIANRATFIDITLGNTEVVLSYVGGNYSKGELEELFDFLFASNANVEQGSLRLLALGVNALMLFEPDEIILESGDGTLEGTTRVAIGRRKGVVEVGTPERALNGTFVRAVGMNRRGMAKRSALDAVNGRPLEYTAIEERCIVAPVPVIVNGEPIFGYSRQRTPQLFGYSHTVSFDEGDLYGTIGLASRRTSAVFRLVTHGVWAQTVGHDFMEYVHTGYEEPLLGGVISFGQLRKTADHSGIIKDATYAQMWQRLLPYLEQLRFGTQANRMADILLSDGSRVKPAEAIELIRDAKGLVILPVVKLRTDPASAEHARQVGATLSFPVMGVDADQEKFVRSVAGNMWPVVASNPDDPDELLLYQKPEQALPARPWLIEPIEWQTTSMDEINAYIESSDMAGAYGLGGSKLRGRFWGGQRAIKTTLYTQFDSAQDEVDGRDDKAWADLRVWIQVCGRLVQEVRLPTFYPGQVLVVEIPDMQPARLRQSVQRGEPAMAVMIAQALAAMYATTLNDSVRQAIQGLGTMPVLPGSLGARWIVAGLATSTITRLNAELGQEASMSIALVDRTLDPALLDIPVLETLTGEAVSVRELAGMIRDGHGLVYGVIPEVEADLAGLDRSKILRLDQHLERLLVELLGEASYVRVDGRDILAEYRGVQCRDIALGLRTYSGFPLLVEGVDPTEWPESERLRCISALVNQLRAKVNAGAGRVPDEDRRQALRHLQWFAVHREDYSQKLAETGIDDEGLFLTSKGKSASYAILRMAQGQAGHLRMLDGLARDLVGASQSSSVGLKALTASEIGPEKRLDLVMNPFVFWLLNERGSIVGLTDHGLLSFEMVGLSADDDGSESVRYLDQIELKDERFEGVLMLPYRREGGASESTSVKEGAVLVVSEDRANIMAMEDAFHAYGVVGVVKLHVDRIELGELTQLILQAAKSMLSRQVNRLANGTLTQGEDYEQAVLCLLGYAGQHLQLTMQPDGMIGARVVDLMANRVLELPVFSARHGTPVSIRRLFYGFRNAYFANPATEFEELSWASEILAVDEVSEPMRVWLLEHFHPDRIRRVAERRSHRVDHASMAALASATDSDEGEVRVLSGEEKLVASIRYWLHALRPDRNPAYDDGTLALPVADFRLEEHKSMEQRKRKKADTLMVLDVGGGVRSSKELVIWLNPEHWLVRWALSDDMREVKPLAWLLMAVYAHINEVLVEVDNRHERVFQQRIFSALQGRTLKWVD